MASKRKITVNNRVWTYFIGSGTVCARADDNNEKQIIKFDKLTGLTNSDIERGEWKRWFHITPKYIAGWLGAL
jgi:hypothetical protein